MDKSPISIISNNHTVGQRRHGMRVFKFTDFHARRAIQPFAAPAPRTAPALADRSDVFEAAVAGTDKLEHAAHHIV